MLAKEKKAEEQVDSLSWEADLTLALRRSERLAWRVAGGAFLVVVIMACAWVRTAFQGPPEPKVIAVDRFGEARVLDTAETFITNRQLNDKHWIKKFVVARERYKYKFLQQDYDTVKLLSAPKVWAVYEKLYNEEDGLDKKYGDSREITPEIISIVEKNGLATIRFSLRTVDARLGELPPVRRVATLRYVFKPQDKRKEAEGIDNPLNYTVEEYQTDAELAGVEAAR